MFSQRNDSIKNFMAVFAVIIALSLVGHAASIVTFNQTLHTTHGLQEKNASYFDLKYREDSTSSWLKRDFELDGQTVDLSAQTIDGTFFNNSDYEISDWTMRIDITDDCFLNNAWCGKMEIHQFTGTSHEATQTLDLRNYELEDIKLKYTYDGDLLIPLQKGDYLLYYPSEKDRELRIKGHSELTMGVIFYFLGGLDLSHYTVEYHYHRNFNTGLSFYAVLTLIIIWLLLIMLRLTAAVIYKRATREMEMKKSTLSCMSEIYNIIYMIDLEKNTLIPVNEDEKSAEYRPDELSAKEQLDNMFRLDAEDAYQDLMLDFANLDTLPERLVEGSIACEYKSREYGWNRIRFFAMDRSEEEPLRRVLFTIQDINAEKLEMIKAEKRISHVESESRAKITFLDTMSQEIRLPIQRMIQESGDIIDASQDDYQKISSLAGDINDTGNMLLAYIDGVLDAAKYASGTLELSMAKYSFRALFSDISHTMVTALADQNIRITFDISPQICDGLFGDAGRLKQIILYLLSNAVKYTKEGTVEVAVFGKQTGDMEHLLISVKDNGCGMDEQAKKKLERRLNHQTVGLRRMSAPDGIGVGLQLVTALLKMMDSELKFITKENEGTEFYFEIEQKVLDETPVGNINFEETL